MNFLKRLLFPKTASLEDREVEIAYQRRINERLIDAIVRGRGGNPVFSKPEPQRARQISSPEQADDEEWRTNAILLENERLVDRAVGSEEGFWELQEMADAGNPGAQELLEQALVRLQERQSSPQ